MTCFVFIYDELIYIRQYNIIKGKERAQKIVEWME